MTSTYIHHIDTAVPDTCYTQEEARDRIKEQIEDRRARRIIHRIYGQSGILRRYTAVDSFGSDDPEKLFSLGPDGKMKIPGTGHRNRRFAEVSKPLSVDLARRTIDACPGIEREDVTHVITASCTGFYNPGPDYHIIRSLDLAPTTQRYHLGFMGCYAAFPALRMAQQFCEADPRAVVLIVCLELCSLHLQLDGTNIDTLLAGSLFADGAAGVVVSAREPTGDQPVYRMRDLYSDLVPAGEDSMTWDIGDRGFDIVLSTYVPSILGSNVASLMNPVLDRLGMEAGDIRTWAVHPGGRAILDKIRDGLGLQENQLASSRRVLRDYGNMSSPTVLFVLKDNLNAEDDAEVSQTAAMAFGPGLTVEFALLERIPARAPHRSVVREPALAVESA